MYPPPYNMPEFPPMSSTRLNYQHHPPVPSPYVAETTIQMNTPLPNQVNHCKGIYALLCIVLVVACIFYTVVLLIELGKLSCKPQINPLIILGTISAIGLTLMSLFCLGYLSMMYMGFFRALIIITSIISFLSSAGFIIYVWIMRSRHIGICYIKGGFSPILIALGFIEAFLAIIIPVLTTI